MKEAVCRNVATGTSLHEAKVHESTTRFQGLSRANHRFKVLTHHITLTRFIGVQYALRMLLSAVENVIFLGAGASASDGAPVQARLFREYFDLPANAANTDVTVNLRRFFESFFGIDVDEERSQERLPTFEEALGLLELAIQRKETFKIEGTAASPEELESMREQLVFLICLLLRQKLEGTKLADAENTHARFLKNMGYAKATRFVSLNYDLLIDNALIRADEYPDYGVAFANWPREPDWGRTTVGLFKLHGSLNWLRCPACSSITCTGTVKGAAYPEKQRVHCTNCQSPTSAVVVPPTFFKAMSEFHLQQIWHEAEVSLTKTRNIFFCGYSMPDADIHIKYLLKRAEMSRGGTPEVFIYNGHAGKLDREKREEEKRFRRVFRQPGHVHYVDASFQHLADNASTLVPQTV